MSFSDSILVSLFGISIVFAVLIALSFALKLQSIIFRTIAEKNKKVTENNTYIKEEVVTGNVVQVANGELSLIDVDEKTAALVMAIVSDELKMPLSELQFKYIKAVD